VNSFEVKLPQPTGVAAAAEGGQPYVTMAGQHFSVRGRPKITPKAFPEPEKPGGSFKESRSLSRSTLSVE